MSVVLHMPPNEGGKINTVWLFVSYEDTGEGICGAQINGTMMSMITARENNLKPMTATAKALAKASGKKIKLIKLTMREEIAEFDP